MSHYPFATHASHTLGLSFVTEARRTARLFARSKSAGADRFPAVPLEEARATDDSFTFGFDILDNQQAVLAVEVNAWSARPYRAPTLFLLGHAMPFDANGDEVPYTLIDAKDPLQVDRGINFTYHPFGRGHREARPYLQWNDELGGTGEIVFTDDSPGAVIGMRMALGVSAQLRLGKTSPWGNRTVVWPDPRGPVPAASEGPSQDVPATPRIE